MLHTTRRPTATRKAATQTSGRTILSDATPAGLVQSTGNLYWTSNTKLGIEPTGTAKVYRASKSNIPGEETILYQETMTNDGIAAVNFGAITYAHVSGNWFGYFVANYPLAGHSQIKRVPLAGGPAVVLATSPAQIGNDDLATHGTSLYWADAAGIRKMPIGGGRYDASLRWQLRQPSSVRGARLLFRRKFDPQRRDDGRRSQHGRQHTEPGHDAHRHGGPDHHPAVSQTGGVRDAAHRAGPGHLG